MTVACREAELQLELERLRKLPPRSVYASHRITVVQRALQLLAVSARSATEDDELTRLLSGLAL